MNTARPLQLKDLNYSYPDGSSALHNINLTLEEGLKTALLGANGSGKTTLIMHINGLLCPVSGSVQVYGRTLVRKNFETVRRLAGLLFDNPDNQLFSTTVSSDVAFGPRNLGLKAGDLHKAVESALETMDIAALAHKPPSSLSLGQKKRAAIAGLLAMEPRLLACDEPFSGLDPRGIEQFKQMLNKLVHEGLTLFFSTHDVDLAYAWADRVVIMQGGKVLGSGDHELLRNEELLEEAALFPPLLVRLFRDRPEKPRTVEEALTLPGFTRAQ